MSFQEKIPLITENYNKTYHICIKYAPIEALKKVRTEAMINNSNEGTYSKKFGKKTIRNIPGRRRSIDL